MQNFSESETCSQIFRMRSGTLPEVCVASSFEIEPAPTELLIPNQAFYEEPSLGTSMGTKKILQGCATGIE